MKNRRTILRIIIAAILLYIIASNIFLIKPFKDLKPEDFSEVGMSEMVVSYVNFHSDESIIKETLNALKKIRLTKAVPEPIITNTANFILLKDHQGNQINVMEARPYLFINGVWYQGDNGSFNSVYRVYEKYMHVK